MSVSTMAISWLPLVFALIWPTASVAEDTPPPGDETLAATIVQKADLVRFPAEGFEVGITITTTARDDKAGRALLEAFNFPYRK